MSVRAATSVDMPAWQRFRRALWPEVAEGAVEDEECERMLSQTDKFAVFVSESDDRLTGFIEASLRDYADGCDTSPVGCVEGWYVEPHARRTGIGRQLVAAAEDWARSKGCTEMASQALLNNADGRHAHEHLGYDEVEQQVCYRKYLGAH